MQSLRKVLFGIVLGNEIEGQAWLNPLACNLMLFFAAAMRANIDKKLDDIKETPQEMADCSCRKRS